MDANEIAFLSMDNIWRANQLFFMVGPIQGFSVFTGTKNFLSYLLYGQDIGGWAGGDLTQVSIGRVPLRAIFAERVGREAIDVGRGAGRLGI